MKPRLIEVLFYFSVLFISPVFSQQDWNQSFPGNANIGQGASIKREQLKLQVPESYEGRTANEYRTIIGMQLQNTVRFRRKESKVQLRGSSTTFDFDYTEDVLDVQIFRSKQMVPGSNSCMDCHGGNFARTGVIIGQKYQELLPLPYKRGFVTIMLDPATSDSYHTEINHWVSHNLMLKGDYAWGYLKQGNYSLEAKAYTLGLAGRIRRRLLWSADCILSKVDSYPQRKTFVGNLSYRLFDGLKLSCSGGAFLDGYTQFGTEMSEMGLMTTTLAKDDPDLLPSLFSRLKDESFGYWQYSIEYEYRF